ncbi:GNAT family N-acetyltransferase [Reinekea blandensis]|uniref:Ribosomal-protein-serine acetyltransferase n=1 Tax=Reinekea blandensis MED297 TaxID=314283 RepID=A4BGW2_9GAMM|nr:GNAT family protein [Reinekea blandensis]EAR08608.1 ribosomal-protein-serine acetyltransferase [Reinekea sp. MED297] [Reinekea blandensis MED297]
MFTIEVTERLSLELISYQRSQSLFELVDRDRRYLRQWLVWPEFIQSEADYSAFIKRSLIEYANEESLIFTILMDQTPVGTAGFVELNKNLEKAEVGYWLAESAQGQGIATQVVQALVQIGFDRLGLFKIEASVAVENFKSQRVCERAGMTLEGIMANAERINNRLLSHKKYALMRS